MDIFSQPSKRTSDYQIPGVDGGRRYKLPIPGSSKPVFWVSATTLAGAIKNSYAIDAWNARNIVKGIGRRPDLYALAAAAEEDDTKGLNEIAQRAREAAGGNYGSSMGTAYHRFSELVDEGKLSQIPAAYRDDVLAYQEAVAEAGLTMLGQYTERILVVPEVQVSGCVDRIVQLADQELPVIGDVKTAKHIDYSFTEIAIQLALYAHATHIWDTDTETYTPMPAVDQTKALIFWLPVGKAECSLIWIDIRKGWEMVKLCQAVMAARSSAKKLAKPF